MGGKWPLADQLLLCVEVTSVLQLLAIISFVYSNTVVY